MCMANNLITKSLALLAGFVVGQVVIGQAYTEYESRIVWPRKADAAKAARKAARRAAR
jgi:hypothetical protein